jgi:hypothetical protein
MTALARASSSCKLQIHPLVTEDELKKLLVVSLKGLVAKTN